MEIREATLQWAADFFLSVGRNVTILEPEELIRLMEEKAKKLYQQYCGKEDWAAGKHDNIFLR